MNIFREKYVTSSSAVLFVMASDDDKWCKDMFANETDVVFTSSLTSPFSEKQPTFDLAILSQCNHSIIRQLLMQSFFIAITSIFLVDK
jgi:hypothetical protein